jgi:hypothetical protein
MRLRLSERDILESRHRQGTFFASSLGEKFASVHAFGSAQVVEFHGSTDPEERVMQARRALKIVHSLRATFAGWRLVAASQGAASPPVAAKSDRDAGQPLPDAAFPSTGMVGFRGD